MASYEMEMAVEPVNQIKERVSDWDMSYYDEIEDFARKGVQAEKSPLNC